MQRGRAEKLFFVISVSIAFLLPFRSRNKNSLWMFLRGVSLCLGLLAGISLNAQKTDSLLLENGIGRAIGYLNNRIDSNQIYYLITPLLIPISQYYNLPISNRINLLETEQTNEKVKQEIALYGAFYKFKRRRESYHLLHQKWNGIDGLNLYSLYCDKALAKKEFLKLFDSSLTLKGYDLSHAYLATLIIKRTKCICKKDNFKLVDLAWMNLKKTIPGTNQIEFSDLNIETIALAIYGGEIESISPELILKLLTSQNMDGSWGSLNNSSTLLTDHSTVLALWALLEWKFRDDSFLYLPMN